MLDDHADGGIQLTELVERLPCSIRLPASWVGFFSSDDETLPSLPGTRRRYERRRLRIKAALLYRQTAPSYPRGSQWRQIYVKDISLGGIAFYHNEQLFPRERMRLVLPGRTVERLMPQRIKSIIEVVRCRRIQDGCYEVAGQFVEDFGETAGPP